MGRGNFDAAGCGGVVQPRGPDAPESVRPFLENLFTDPAILRVPGFIRPWLGRFIAKRRTKAASEITPSSAAGRRCWS
ncbi:ferrochelatase [Paeniroseomonas aquatica]|uniref:ferrochelatase n=1 Tax=Paeniroseomonas aquatica TaxID=373043 RepID=UPI0036180B74